MKKRTPHKIIALKQFHKQFGDLISVSAEVTDGEQVLIEDINEHLWYENFTRADLDEIDRTARAASHFLIKGTGINHEEVAIKFIQSIGSLTPALNRSVKRRMEIKEGVSYKLDKQIENYLEYYKLMYEGLSTICLAPILFSFKIANSIEDDIFVPRSDGKVNLNALNAMEKWLVYPQNRLAVGLNKHIRNAYSHENYRILDDGNVELWDVDPRRREKSWGPEIWSLDDLKAICNRLWINSLGITYALIIFSINNRKLIRERGWAEKVKIEPIKLRRRELKNLVAYFADQLSFDLIDFQDNDVELKINLSTRPKGIDQEEKLIMGGKRNVRTYGMSVKYYEVMIVNQILGLMQKLVENIDKKVKLIVNVASYDKKPIGVILVDSEIIKNLKGPDSETITEIRKCFEKDTIGNHMMYVKSEGAVKDC